MLVDADGRSDMYKFAGKKEDPRRSSCPLLGGAERGEIPLSKALPATHCSGRVAADICYSLGWLGEEEV